MAVSESKHCLAVENGARIHPSSGDKLYPLAEHMLMKVFSMLSLNPVLRTSEV